MKFTIAKLKLTAPLHLSQGKSDFDTTDEVLHADSLKSALFVAGRELFGPDEFSDRSFFDSFQVSSAYPFLGDELFFPKPMLNLKFPKSDEGEAILLKKRKKLKYLGQSYFEQALAGEELKIEEKNLLQKGTFATELLVRRDLNEDFNIYTKDLQQRVRIYSSSEIRGQVIEPLTYNVGEEDKTLDFSYGTDTFYVERIHYSGGVMGNSGLFVMFPLLTDEQVDKLSPLFRYLGEKGVGKNRNLGFGSFEFEKFENIELHLPQGAKRWMNMGLYCPAGDETGPKVLTEEILKNSSYNLILRGGWISNPAEDKFLSYRKKSVYMFQEGSVFTFGKQEKEPVILGKLENLMPKEGPKHPIWREGRALFLPIV